MQVKTVQFAEEPVIEELTESKIEFDIQRTSSASLVATKTNLDGEVITSEE